MPAQAFTIYIDDSGEKEYGQRTSRYFVYAGVIVAAAEENRVNRELAALKAGTFGTADVELKSNWLRIPRERERRYLQPFGVTSAQVAEFVDALYGYLGLSPISLLAAVIDKVEMTSRYTHPWYPSATSYQFLLQRYEKHLAGQDGVGQVTIDNMEGASPKSNQWRDLLRTHHARLKKDGCNITKLRFDHVAPTIRFGDSKRFHLLQVADLVAYNVFRQFRDYGENWDDPAKGDLPLYKPLGRIIERFLRGPKNQLQGWGIVKWPALHKGRWCLTPEELRGA
jgi:hypothetical protein